MVLLTRREFFKLLGIAPIPVGLGFGASDAFARLMTPDPAVSFIVNGRSCTINSTRSGTLLDYLRYDLDLPGVKYGCGRGVCGSCTVLIQGRVVRSCVVDIQHLNGLEVTTVEGVGGARFLDPIQRTFADLCVFQCGYCAPGFVLATRALLNKTPNPSEMQVREALYGNLCRCTGYRPILEAVRAVNDPEFFRHLLQQPFSGVAGFSGDKLAKDKVTGRLKYAADHQIPHQIFARIVFSEHPHAIIDAIDTEEAERSPGVVNVLTHRDVPGKNSFGAIIADQPVFAGNKVRCLGDAVALVVAESDGEALAAARLVSVSYTPLPGIFDFEESLAADAPQMTPKGNVCWETSCTKGSIDKGRLQSAFIEKQVYHTPFIEHAYLETESCVTYINDKGYLMVVSASQAPHSYRDQIAAICNLPADRVVMQTTVAGGAFGAKGDLSIQHLCALATLKTGRPVRLQLTREESIRLHVKRHPFRLEYETGVDLQGNLTHCLVRALADAGAYHSASLAVMENAAAFCTGPYAIENIDVQVKAVFTNNPVCGAMRGFGVLQVCLAMERQVEELSRKLNMDPLSLRLQNCLDTGRVTQWGQVLGQGTGIKKCLQELHKAVRGEKEKIIPGHNERVGLGFGACYKNTSSPTNTDWGRADLYFTLNRHGRFIIYAGGSELGQGFVSAIAQFGAHGLGVPVELVEVVFGSTTHTQSPTLTSASQQTFLAGKAALEGGERFARRIIAAAAELYSLDTNDLSLGPGGIVIRQSEDIVATYHEVSWRSQLAGKPLSFTYTYEPPLKTIDPPKQVTKIGPDQAILPSLGYAAQAALVKVNEQTGEVEVLKIFAAHDVGRVANPRAAHGQVVGGVVMALGGCLKEKLEVKDGRIVTDNLDTYTIPRTKDVPEIEVLLVEEADPLGPLGAKGLGELPTVPTAPAVLNAIRDAVGIRLNTIPVESGALMKKFAGKV